MKSVNVKSVSILFSGNTSLATSIAAYENPRSTGAIMGFSIASFYIGSLMFQPVIGYVAEYWGKQYIMHIILITAVMCLILSFILYKFIGKKYNIKLKIFNKQYS